MPKHLLCGTLCLVMALSSIHVDSILPSSPLWLSNHNLGSKRRNNYIRYSFYESDQVMTEQVCKRHIFQQKEEGRALQVPFSSE